VVSVQQSLVPRLKGPGAHYAAQIRLENIEPVYNQLTSLQFTSDTNKIKKVADQKLEIVNRLNKELAEIIKYDSAEEIVGALELLGRTSAHMADALLRAPLPPEVVKDEATKQNYLAAVKEMARPFQVKAIESYRGAIQKAKDLETYTKPYFVSMEALRVLDPNARLDLGQEASPHTYQDWMGFK
jgi:hypothetical protein